MKKTKYLLFLSFFVVFLLANGVSAKVSTNDNTLPSENNSQKYTDQKCGSIQTRISAEISTYDNNKKRHLNAFNNMQDRLNKLQVRLSDDGYDTTKLVADQKELDIKIATFAGDYGKFVELLKSTRLYSCGRTRGEVKTYMAATRDQMKLVKQDNLDIRSYYVSIIRPDLIEIKKQTPTVNTGSGSGTAQTGEDIAPITGSGTE